MEWLYYTLTEEYAGGSELYIIITRHGAALFTIYLSDTVNRYRKIKSKRYPLETIEIILHKRLNKRAASLLDDCFVSAVPYISLLEAV